MSMDDYLHQQMILYLNNKEYDFLHGAIGIGMYFFGRFRNTKNDVLRSDYKNIILGLIDKLEELSEIDSNGRFWYSPNEGNEKQNEINLGLSHGMASITGFFTQLVTHKVFKSRVHQLLVDSLKFIISQKGKSTLSFFPNCVIDGQENQYNSRVAWCYGDLGIGLSLQNSALALNDQSLLLEVNSMLEHTSSRKSYEETKVLDLGCCHGNFGVVQLFYRAFLNSGNLIFKKTSEYWLSQGLEFDRKHSFEYPKWKSSEKKFIKDISIINGYSGIGLALIHQIADFDMNWDECLMIK